MGLSGFYVEFFFVSVPKNTVGDPFSLSIIPGIEKYWMRGWCGGMSRFSVGNFLSHSAEKRLGEPFSHSSVLGIEKVWISGGGEEGSITSFCRKLFVSQCRNIFWGNTSVLCFCVSEKFRQQKKLWISSFSVESFLSQLAKKFRRGNFCAVFQKFSWSQKVYG